ncbi:MAG: tetratricopeptide repeat protein [Bacteroidetes bacterium]|nr:tetratricopeptide repeat protein [Bacteroidota bacterium]
MKKHFVVVCALMASTIVFGQKKELKKAEKALTELNYSESLALLNQAEAKFAEMDKDQVVQFYLIKTEALLGSGESVADNNLTNAIEALSQAKSRGLDTERQDRADKIVGILRGVFVNKAIEAQNGENYGRAAELLTQGYTLSPTDTSFLYYAAGNLVNGGMFDKALEKYNQLLGMGYTGVREEFYAVSKANGEEVMFESRAQREEGIKFGLYEQPRDVKTESVESDLLQKVTLIYINQGQDDKAVALMARARAANPNDVNLMRSEADLAYKRGDIVKYREVMEQVVQTDPNNPELFYNLGVSSMQVGETDRAKTYYARALELDPNYSYAQINMASLILQGEKDLVEEMNNLGTSAADNRRYDELKEERNEMYREALPYLEGASQTVPDNVEVLRTLMNLYSQLGMTPEYKAAKAKVAELEGK